MLVLPKTSLLKKGSYFKKMAFLNWFYILYYFHIQKCLESSTYFICNIYWCLMGMGVVPEVVEYAGLYLDNLGERVLVGNDVLLPLRLLLVFLPDPEVVLVRTPEGHKSGRD